MPDTQDVFKQGLDQMTALTRSWLTPPGANTVASGSERLEYLTDFATDLQRLYSDAIQHHMDPLLKSNAEIPKHFAKLTQSRDPKDLADFQLELLGMMMETASVRAETWGELADKVGHRYAEFVREMAGNLQAQADAKNATESGAGKRAVTKVSN
ncbi:hypothetical protein [Thioclava indica]|uniref:Phasin domain-containing protein n=1 Tax=Thioclava indica TaxID=1353528 RepID=A0A074JDZ5_9RHOB|nr:hypothetical protein [Thioclava indica]KEO53813.1 hypothetical protein DT23_06495 [Thioclava indica]